MNSNILVRMASFDVEEELKKAGMEGLPSDIMTAYKDLLVQKKSEEAKEAAEEIMKLVDKSSHVIMKSVNNIRAYRQEIEKEKKKLAKINRAKAYGMSTRNFLPLIALTYGEFCPSIVHADKSLCKVPKDWTEPDENSAE